VPAGPGDENRSNLVVELGPQPPEILLIGHVDTVTLWPDEGHGARLEGDRLYGLGSADMKGGCSAILEAMVAVLESGVPLSKGCCAALVVGEEEEGDGAEALTQIVRAPLTVVGEPTDLRPCTHHYGYLESRFSGSGTRSHAALPELGSNAIHAMLEWILAVYDGSRSLSIGDRLAINPREIHGGEPGFVIADSCEATIDFHLPPPAACGGVEELIEKARKSVLTRHTDLDLRYERIHWAPGFEHDGDDPALNPLRKAYEALGMDWEPDTFLSHSDANLFNESGTLTVVCGPGNLAQAHRRGEHVSIEEVELAARLYATMIHEACGDSETR
jgi:acetylornithine deacetylase